MNDDQVLCSEFASPPEEKFFVPFKFHFHFLIISLFFQRSENL